MDNKHYEPWFVWTGYSEDDEEEVIELYDKRDGLEGFVLSVIYSNEALGRINRIKDTINACAGIDDPEAWIREAKDKIDRFDNVKTVKDVAMTEVIKLHKVVIGKDEENVRLQALADNLSASCGEQQQEIVRLKGLLDKLSTYQFNFCPICGTHIFGHTKDCNWKKFNDRIKKNDETRGHQCQRRLKP